MLILVGERSGIFMSAAFISLYYYFFLLCSADLFIAKYKFIGIFSVLGNWWGFKELSVSATQFAGS